MKNTVKTLLRALTLSAVVGLALIVAPAGAETSAPAWGVTVQSAPTIFPRTGEGSLAEGRQYYYVLATNLGGAPTEGPFKIVDQLPPGVEPAAGRFPEGINRIGDTGFNQLFCSIAGSVVTCEGSEEVVPGESANAYIPVEVTPTAPDELTNEVLVEGGGASATQANSVTQIGSGKPDYGFSGFTGNVSDAIGGGGVDAGSHPYQATVNLQFPTFVRPDENLWSVAEPKVIGSTLPRGMYANPLATPVRCRESQFEADTRGGGCPRESQIGIAVLGVRTVGTEISSAAFVKPIYSMIPPSGAAAEFAFDAELGVYVHLLAHARSDGEYELSAKTSNVPAKLQLASTAITLWGSPSDKSHDRERIGCIGQSKEKLEQYHVDCTIATRGNKALLTLPSDCSGRTLPLEGETSSWVEPDAFIRQIASLTDLEGNPIRLGGCNQLEFNPTVRSQPTTPHADSPAGYEVDVHQRENPLYGERATPNLKDAEVTLPAGVSLNPAAANGLGSCTEEEIGFQPSDRKVRFSEDPQSCPNSAKIGTIQVSTPLVDHKLPGGIYVAKPFANPFGSMLAIYLAVEDPASGTIAKLAGRVSPDPQTGQLSTTFTENPQLPFEDIDLSFFEGPGAALKTPLACGAYTTDTALVPWSTPEGATAHPIDTFQTSSSASGAGACPRSESKAPFSPTFTAGTAAPQAGAFSPFLLKLTRPDGEQHVTGINTTLPGGLLGKLAGISYCPEAAIALARSREAPEQGKVEQASPSCPAASEVGSVTVGAGAGITPFYATGHVYLAGPYKGAALSLVVIAPAVAGPFDLGNVVTRVALNVDPYSAQINAVSDPLPTIIQGIPLDIRSIALKLDRPGFTLNPTNCEVKSITGAAIAQTGQSAPLTNRFQVGGCKSLAFKPTLKLSLKGAVKRAGHPSLKAVVTYPKQGSYANIAGAQVGLPHSEFLDQSNLNNVCTQPQLRSQSCPAKSIYGKVKAWTPLLQAPLEGPVYLGVGFGHKLPDLVAELNGQLRVLLHGRVDTDKKGGIRNTFETVPDAPVSRFVLELKGGKKKGLLVNSENICRKTQRAQARFTGQNGKVLTLTPKIANSCKGKKHKGGKKSSH